MSIAADANYHYGRATNTTSSAKPIPGGLENNGGRPQVLPHLVNVQATQPLNSLDDPRLSKLLSQLAEISELEGDWDGLETEAPNSFAIGESIFILLQLEKCGFWPDRVVPSAEGGVGIVFLKNSKQADIEIFNSGETFAGIYPEDRVTEVWPVQHDDIEETVKQLREFLR